MTVNLAEPLRQSIFNEISRVFIQVEIHFTRCVFKTIYKNQPFTTEMYDNIFSGNHSKLKSLKKILSHCLFCGTSACSNGWLFTLNISKLFHTRVDPVDDGVDTHVPSGTSFPQCCISIYPHEVRPTSCTDKVVRRKFSPEYKLCIKDVFE